MATTPIYAIPYPVGTDRVADGDNAMQAIAERVEALLAGYARATATSGALNSAVWGQLSLSALAQVGGFSIASNGAGATNTRLLVPKAGRYLVTAQVAFQISSGNGTGARYVVVGKNSAGAPQTAPIVPGVTTGGNPDEAVVHFAGQVALAAGDYLEVGTFQSSGVAKTSTGALQVTYQGPA